MTRAAVEVAVVGAGPAGVATALGCARRGLEVALLDRAHFPRDKPCGEGLLPQAVDALAALGLLSRVAPHACRLDGIVFSVAGGPRAQADFCDGAGAPAFGLGVRRRVLDALLVEAARAQPGVTLLEGVTARDLQFRGAQVTGLQTSVGPLEAEVVVAADGLRSPMRARLGLELPARRPPRLGLRVHFRLPHALAPPRLVEVLVSGAIEYYLTPVADDELEVAVLGPARAFAALELSAATLVAHLLSAATENPELGARLQGAVALDRPLGAGPFRQRARAVVTSGALLVGDAAGYFDALTGEGVGLALASGDAAAQAIFGALSTGGGAAPTARALAPYARAYRALIRSSDRLARLALFFARRPRRARFAISTLARSPSLFHRLLAVQAGAH
jgi:flavin-dependent dehydrogenase